MTLMVSAKLDKVFVTQYWIFKESKKSSKATTGPWPIRDVFIANFESPHEKIIFLVHVKANDLKGIAIYQLSR